MLKKNYSLRKHRTTGIGKLSAFQSIERIFLQISDTWLQTLVLLSQKRQYIPVTFQLYFEPKSSINEKLTTEGIQEQENRRNQQLQETIQKQDMVAYAYNHYIGEWKVRASGVKSHNHLQSKVKAQLAYKDLSPNNSKTKTKKNYFKKSQSYFLVA